MEQEKSIYIKTVQLLREKGSDMKTGPIATLVCLAMIIAIVGNFIFPIKDVHIISTMLFCTMMIVQVLEKRE